MINSVKDLRLKHFDIEVKDYPELSENYCADEFIPRGRNGLDPVVVSDDFDWSKDIYKDRNWMFQLHSLRMMDPYLINAVKSLTKGDIKHAIQSAQYGERILNRWIDFHKEKKSKYEWYDMSVGLRSLRIVLLYYIFYFSAGAARVKNYVQVLESHLDNLSDESKINKGNHGLFQISALKCVAELLNQYSSSDSKKKYEQASILASRLMEEHIKSQFTENGLHVENSPDYHFFVLSKVKSFLASAWWVDLRNNSKINSLLVKANILKYWLVDPYGKCLPIGDSSESQRIKDFSEEMWDVDKITYRGYSSFCIDGYYQVRGVDRKNDSFLFFMGAHHSDVHRHDDLQSFIWQENGQYLLWDSGKYGYKSDKYRRYFKSEQAHNTLILRDKTGVRISDNGIKNTIFVNGVDSSGWWYVKAKDVIATQKGKIEKIREVWFKPKIGVIVFDFIEGGVDQEIEECELRWHIGPIGKIEWNDDLKIEQRLGNSRLFFSFFSNMAVINSKVISGDSEKDEISLVSRSYLDFEESSKLLITMKYYPTESKAPPYAVSAFSYDGFSSKSKVSISSKLSILMKDRLERGW